METNNNEKKVDFSDFIEKHNELKSPGTGNVLWNKEKVIKKKTGWINPSDVSKYIKENKEKVVFGFNDSFVVFENFIYSTSSSNTTDSRILNFDELDKIEVKKKGFMKTQGYYLNDIHFDNFFGFSDEIGISLFEEFKNYIKPSFEEEEVVDIGLLLRENMESQFLTDENTIKVVSVENYLKLLKESQPRIVEVDREYIQKFVKIGSYLKSTQQNIFRIYEKIFNMDFSTGDFMDLSEYINDGSLNKFESLKYLSNEMEDWTLLESKAFIDKHSERIEKNGGIRIVGYTGSKAKNYIPIIKDLNQHIISYQLLILNSFMMIKSLDEDDMITFYEMYEVFDKLGIFDSQWQKSMLEKLSDINSSIFEVSESLNQVNNTIKSSFEQLTDDLTYQLEDGFDWVVINMNK